MQQQRLEYWQQISEVPVENLVFIDESGILLGLQRLVARAPVGERAYAQKPFYRGSKVSIVGAITQKGVLAYEMLKGSFSGETFLEFVQQNLVPKLWRGAVVVMDNLSAHKVTGVVEAIEAVGAKVIYLSPYSPEFNPIEHWWSQLKDFLRQFVPKATQTVEQLTEIAVMLSFPRDFRNWFAHCCYCSDND